MAEGREYHPNDPTIPLWEKLLPKGRAPRGPMSEEQKAELSRKMRAHFIDHPNPFEGLPLPTHKKKRKEEDSPTEKN